MDLNDFITFNPLTDNGYVLPKAPGNYLVTIRDIKALPTLGCRIVTRHFRGQELIYTGITKTDLYHRIWKSHIGSHAGRSTLRLTLGGGVLADIVRQFMGNGSRKALYSGSGCISRAYSTRFPSDNKNPRPGKGRGFVESAKGNRSGPVVLGHGIMRQKAQPKPR